MAVTPPTAVSESTKTKRAKKQPTGDYPTGYCRPPAEHRFDGTKPGPGRPKGAVSQDTLWRKHLEKTRHISIEGRQVKVTQREIAIMLEIKDALDDKNKQRRAREAMLTQGSRLFVDREEQQAVNEAMAVSFDEHDLNVLDTLRAKLRGEPEMQS